MNPETWTYPRWYRLAVVPFTMVFVVLVILLTQTRQPPVMVAYIVVFVLAFACRIVDAFQARVTIDDDAVTVRRFPLGGGVVPLSSIRSIHTSATLDSVPLRVESEERTLRITWPLGRRREMAEVLIARLGDRVEVVDTDGVHFL